MVQEVHEPIIVLGYPKSGTTSVYHYFKCSGLRTQHYCSRGDLINHPPCPHGTMGDCMARNIVRINHGENITIFEKCGKYQVYAQLDSERGIVTKTINGKLRKGTKSDTGEFLHVTKRMIFPQHFNLDMIHQAFPNATYILTIRDPYAWASSVMRWFHLKNHILNEYEEQGLTEKFILRDIRNQTGLLARILLDHTAMVRQFCRDHPSHRCVEVDITSETAGQELADTFVNTKASCWKHANKNKKKTEPLGAR